ncbi:hypothetical protein KDK67_02855 [Methanococcoides seepicolus]|uniref:Alpha-galactosidase NEW3 domain-containing protein n=2 Tax=Methanococcoides seepicolus TaxID=2828780 RepID=A0A9E5DBC3_9EURY|nr:hypothetical protein [Methanococcoides seepicolus]
MMFIKQNFKKLGIALILIILLTLPPASADWSSVTVITSITGKVVLPGDTVEFPITIEKGHNNSDEAWCSLSIKDKSDGWSAGFYNDGDQVTGLTFPEDKNSSKKITLRVKPPINTPNGAYAIWADFKPDDGDTISQEFVVNVDSEAVLDLDIYSDMPGLETRPNDPVEFYVTLENDYDHRVTASINVAEKPDSWDVEFLEEGNGKYRITKTSIAANDKQNFIVKVRPSTNVSDGTYPVIVDVALENSQIGVSQQLDLTINRGIEEEKMLTIFPESKSINLNPGSSREIVVNLRNSGDRTLNNVELKIQGVSGITTFVRSFGAIDELEPGESREIPVEIKVRADASPDTKEILMRAVSDEAESEDERVEVSVVKSSSGGFIGIGMIIGALLLLVFIVSKFGRR